VNDPVVPAANDAAPAATTYRVDPDRSTITFHATAFGLLPVRGTLPIAQGELRVVGDVIRATGEAGTAGIDTGLAPRDWDLRTAHYLDARKHPRIRLTVEDTPLTTGSVPATLTVRGVSASIRLDVHDLATTEDGVRIQASTSLDRTPFPMLPPIAGVSRLIHIAVDITACPAVGS